MSGGGSWEYHKLKILEMLVSEVGCEYKQVLFIDDTVSNVLYAKHKRQNLNIFSVITNKMKPSNRF